MAPAWSHIPAAALASRSKVEYISGKASQGWMLTVISAGESHGAIYLAAPALAPGALSPQAPVWSHT